MIGLAVSLAISAFAAAKQAKERKRQQSSLDAQNRFNDLWYSAETNRDYFGTDEAKSALKLAQDSIKKNLGRVNSAGAITGMSDEAAVANNSAGMDSLTNLTANLAGRADQRKDRIQGIYLNRKDGLESRQQGIDAVESQKWDNLASNAGNIAEAANINSMIPGQPSNSAINAMRQQDIVTNEMFGPITPLAAHVKK